VGVCSSQFFVLFFSRPGSDQSWIVFSENWTVAGAVTNRFTLIIVIFFKHVFFFAQKCCCGEISSNMFHYVINTIEWEKKWKKFKEKNVGCGCRRRSKALWIFLCGRGNEMGRATPFFCRKAASCGGGVSKENTRWTFLIFFLAKHA